MHIEKLKDNKLFLENNGNLTLYFIGVGGAFTERFNHSNLLIIKGKDHLLIDCGHKCPSALIKAGLSITDIENIFITHSHTDHIGGMEQLILMNRYIKKKKPNIIINETYQHILWDYSLRGGCAFNEENANDILTFHDFFNIIRPKYLLDYRRETMEVTIGSINLKIFRTKHIPNTSNNWLGSFWSCGLIIDDRIMFSGDTRYDEELVTSYDECFNFELIFHDCQFYTGGVHASLDELINLPLEIKNKMLLYHYGDNYEDYINKVKEYGFKGLAEQSQYYVFD